MGFFIYFDNKIMKLKFTIPLFLTCLTADFAI
nr:MAG TPA: hypothetical protein [Bacteriophage sp.]